MKRTLAWLALVALTSLLATVDPFLEGTKTRRWTQQLFRNDRTGVARR
jgi:hypothetical protein